MRPTSAQMHCMDRVASPDLISEGLTASTRRNRSDEEVELAEPTNGTKLQQGFFLYLGDFERSCDRAGLDDAERMGYLRILGSMYSTGGHLPDERAVRGASRLTSWKWRKSGPRLIELLEVEPQGFTHERVLRELAKANRIREVRRRAGEKGAQSRWKDV